ncbi:MAG: hypothetical protein ABIN89_11005 [Chitinophagaceae bacterium]
MLYALHFNNTSLKDIPARIKQALIFGKPVICNEDDKTGEIGAEAARLSVMAGAGWGRRCFHFVQVV